MSRLGRIERHRRSLAEIRGIMNSMKSLAFMETRKLSRKVDAQRILVEGIEKAAADLLSFHPEILPRSRPEGNVLIVVGTERGFCGDFNALLLRQMRADAGPLPSVVLAIGRKLHSKLEGNRFAGQEATLIDGAGVLEEVPLVLDRIVTELESIRAEQGPLGVSVLFHRSEGEIGIRELLPPFAAARQESEKRRFSHPPCLNLDPGDLFADLTDQYLLTSLFEILYASLMNENQHRVTHLGVSVKHLDQRLTALMHKSNALRQEEITEEIEVILLSAVDESATGP